MLSVGTALRCHEESPRTSPRRRAIVIRAAAPAIDQDEAREVVDAMLTWTIARHSTWFWEAFRATGSSTVTDGADRARTTSDARSLRRRRGSEIHEYLEGLFHAVDPSISWQAYLVMRRRFLFRLQTLPVGIKHPQVPHAEELAQLDVTTPGHLHVCRDRPSSFLWLWEFA